MPTYLVNRPGIAAGAAELDAALTRLRSFEEKNPDALRARWMHSYALAHADGRFGLACVFEADSAQALRRHAAQTALAAREILPVATTLELRAFAPAMVHLIRRRRFCKTLADIEKSAAIWSRIGDEMARQVSWLRTYAVHEDDGTLGTVCLYQGIDAQALAEHAARVGAPADDITAVIGRIVYRDDPLHPQSAASRSALA